MMYSNVVMTTWKLPLLIFAAASRRAWGVPLKMTVETEGAHFSNSSVQLVMVERGTMTRKGPRCCFFSIRNVMSESVWIVLPRPCSRRESEGGEGSAAAAREDQTAGRQGQTISSARMPLSRLLYSETIHWRPLIWYSLSVPPTRIVGCAVIFSEMRWATA
jgi:hypothetical protein